MDKKLVENQINSHIDTLKGYKNNLAYYLADIMNFSKNIFSSKDIMSNCFQINKTMVDYNNSLLFLDSNTFKNNDEILKVIINNINIFELILSEINNDDDKKSQEEPYINEVKAFRNNIQNENIKGYFNELVLNLENNCYRSTIIISWVGAVSILQDYIFNNRLDDFNTCGQSMYQKFKEIESLKDFTSLKEYDFIEIIGKMGVVDRNVKKILHQCLEDRNISGHPNEAVLGKQTALKIVEELINNVYKRFL